MTETAIEVRAENPLGDRTILTRDVLAAEKRQRQMVGEFVQSCMVAGTDFGIIPGTPKPTLLKPGAEKLVDLFRCTPKYTLLEKTQDFQAGFFHYMFRVRLVQRDSGAVLAEGYGSANSREARYRWRDGKRKCPKCAKEAIIAGKEEYGGGWLCFAKKGGCGAKFLKEDTTITGQQVGRVENEDIADLANTILKMAKKRALVDGALALARCSDSFTQDLEDMAHEEPAPPPPPVQTTKSSKARAKATTPPPEEPLTPEARDRIEQQFSAAKAQVHHLGKPPPQDDVPPPTEADMPPVTDEMDRARETVDGRQPQLDVIPIGKSAGKRIRGMDKFQLRTILDNAAEWLASPKFQTHKDRATMEAVFHAVGAELDRLNAEGTAS